MTLGAQSADLAALVEALALLKAAGGEHSSHWDMRGTHGANCPACIRWREAVAKADAALSSSHSSERWRPEQREEEYGWLIEVEKSGERGPPGPIYWCGGDRFDTFHMEAIRFARKEDAERTIKGFDGRYRTWGNLIAVSHGWDMREALAALPASEQNT